MFIVNTSTVGDCKFLTGLLHCMLLLEVLVHQNFLCRSLNGIKKQEFILIHLYSRVQNLVQHMKSPILRGLVDRSSYVRRNAVIAGVKLFHLSRETFEGI